MKLSFLSPRYECIKWHTRAFCACTVSVQPVADWVASDVFPAPNVTMKKIVLLQFLAYSTTVYSCFV
jgi:hypothetical protein